MALALVPLLYLAVLYRWSLQTRYGNREFTIYIPTRCPCSIFAVGRHCRALYLFLPLRNRLLLCAYSRSKTCILPTAIFLPFTVRHCFCFDRHGAACTLYFIAFILGVRDTFHLQQLFNFFLFSKTNFTKDFISKLHVFSKKCQIVIRAKSVRTLKFVKHQTLSFPTTANLKV